ncbi:MAG: DUF1667 domain-containing protein [Clostridium perfringens]|nr:DUF1667 domain-containing protein [Clostridium perfringens]
MEKELICIVCPKGCHLKVDVDNKNVTGNSCKRGFVYGLNEVISPTRVVTSTVKIEGINGHVLPVKTENSISKEKIFEIMKEINKVEVKLPIKIGQVIIENILDTGVNIVATKSMT